MQIALAAILNSPRFLHRINRLQKGVRLQIALFCDYKPQNILHVLKNCGILYPDGGA